MGHPQKSCLTPPLSLLAHHANTDFLDFFSSLNRRNLRIITSFLDNKAPLKKFFHHIGLTTKITHTFYTVAQLLSCSGLTSLAPTPLHQIPPHLIHSSFSTSFSLLRHIAATPRSTNSNLIAFSSHSTSLASTAVGSTDHDSIILRRYSPL